MAVLATISLRAARAGAADTGGAAGAFIQQVGRDLPTVVGDASTDQDKRRRLEPFLARVVDVDAVARFCLGRFWDKATPAQQQEYRALFVKVLANAVASRIGAYNPGTSKVVVQPEIEKPDGVYVPTVVQTGSEKPVHITWVVDTAASPYRILDVQAEGMSMRLSQRSDYTAFLNRNGGDIDAFLRAVREHTP